MHRHFCLSFVLLFCALALRVSGHAPDGTEDRHHHIGRQCSSPCADCVLNAEQEEGPYYYDGTIVRSNITETQVGVPLQLLITVVDTNTCDPLAGAAVDVWHCDASGVYSHVVNGAISTSSNGTIWLRGVQLADSTGLVTFYTVYPGWYSGRATHIHVKVHIGGSAAPNGSYTGGHVSHTGQMFFNETTNNAIGALSPYSSNTVAQTADSVDRVYTEQDGSTGVFVVRYVDSTQGYSGGLIASITLGVNSTAVPSGVSSSGTTTTNGATAATASTRTTAVAATASTTASTAATASTTSTAATASTSSTTSSTFLSIPNAVVVFMPAFLAWLAFA